jgi:hypothetical protein
MTGLPNGILGKSCLVGPLAVYPEHLQGDELQNI